MSQINSSNFYEVLGVERSADARAIKKAYFALVRKYPPETHPEEFKKLREAYEVLSDADARKEYDSIGEYDQHGEEVSAQIKQAMQAMDEERYTDAQAVLSELLRTKPDLHFVKDLLGLAYLRNKEFAPAQRIFEELTTAHPGNAAYHLHKAYTHHAQEQYPQAVTSYLRAKELDKEDVRPLVALSDCFREQKNWPEALRTLDEAIHLDGEVDFKDFALFLRKLEIHLEQQDKAAMAATLQELMQIIPDDPQSKRVVANRLSSLAAPLFAQKRTEEANLLMRECAKIDPSRGTGRMPASFEVQLEQLPPESQQWLIEQNKKKSFEKIGRSTNAGAIFLLILALGGIGLALMILFGGRKPLAPEAMFIWGGALAGAALLGAYSIQRIRIAGRSPYGSYIIVHPLYLLDVKLDKLTAYPLVNLHKVNVTHNHTNGAYTGSTLALIFEKRTFNLSISGKAQSEEWADHILAQRRRMLELMFSGLLEDTSEHAKFIPPSLIPEEGKKPVPTERKKAENKQTAKMMWGAAAVGALVALGAVPMNMKKADDRAYRNAASAYRNKVGAYQEYLARYPNGRHTDEAHKAIAKLYDGALAKVKQRHSSALQPMLIDLVNALKESQSSRVKVKYSSVTNFGALDDDKLPPDLRGKVVNPQPAFTHKANESRESRITQALEKAFDEVLGVGFVTLVEANDAVKPVYGKDHKRRGSVEEKLPVTLNIAYEVGLTGSIYSSVKKANEPERKFYGIDISWDFDVTFGEETSPRYAFDLVSTPAKDIRWTSYGYGGYVPPSATLPYDKMAGSCFEDFTRQLTTRFGIKSKYAAEDDYDDEYDDELAPPRKPLALPKKPFQLPKGFANQRE